MAGPLCGAKFSGKNLATDKISASECQEKRGIVVHETHFVCQGFLVFFFFIPKLKNHEQLAVILECFSPFADI